MHTGVCCTVLLSLIACFAVSPTLAAARSNDVSDRIAAAAPAEPCAKPAKRRKLLVFTLTRGFRHESIPLCSQAFKILGDKTGAFEAVISEDIAMFEPSVTYDITRVKGLKNVFFSGEGLFLARLKGPGKIWLQSLPLSNLAAKLVRYMPKKTS